MSSYNLWNEALAARFFSPDMAGRNVHLYVSQDLIDEIGQGMPEAGAFRDAVAGWPTAPITNGENVCKRAYREFRHWRSRGLNFPPYVGYLCFFVLASGTDGDFAPHAYYPRLWTLLKYEGWTGPAPWFDRMWELWDDLENWSVFDKQGELGIFQSRSIGGHAHIGYPLSQALLVERERQTLPYVFYYAGLDPASSHPPGEIALALLSSTARQFMRARTVQMAKKPHDELHKALIEAVTDELAAWDGTVTGTEHGQTVRTLAGLRVCIELDQVAGIARSSIRCKLNHEFPEAGIALDNGLVADEDVNGWSLPVESATTGEPLDASRLDWRNGKTMRSESPSYQLRLKGYPVRIFTSGMPEGISGLVDTHALPQGQPFYLCYPESAWSRLQWWATTQCQGFQDLNIEHGLPGSWRLAKVAAAIDDTAVKNEFPILAFQSGMRLLLVGGIRRSRGNNFFNFAPPSVLLTGSPPDTEVYCNGVLLSPSTSDSVFTLPENLQNGSRITIEARSGKSILRRQSLFLTGDFSLPSGEPEMFLDFAGASVPTDDDEASIAGVYIKGQSIELAALASDVFEDFEYEMGSMQGFLVGQFPGQIVAWPSEPFPSDWIPTWAITKHRRKNWKAVYVGEILGATSPATPGTPTRRNIKDWKEVAWHWRRRILLPERPEERALWRQIQKVARSV